ncbi:UNVERIFIED_ORG: hypothetical protein M2328_002743 [Rhodococcus erythropolis]
MSRVVQLIKRDRHGNNLIVLDIAGPKMGTQGIKATRKSLEGIWHAPRSSTSETTAFIPGSIPGLDRVEERIVKLVLITRAMPGTDWEDVDSLLWEVLAPGEFFVLRVESRKGKEARELTLRRVREPEVDAFYDGDPDEIGQMKWIISATAHDPWWYASEYSRSIKRSEMTPIGDGWFSGLIDVGNLGDQDTYLEWVCNEITVPLTVALPDALGKYPDDHPQAGQQIMHELPELTPGKEFQVNTHPLRETLLVRSDTQDWAKMRAEDFGFALPRRTDPPTPLPIKVKGGTPDTEITVYIPIPYDRPMGW